MAFTVTFSVSGPPLASHCRRKTPPRRRVLPRSQKV